MADDHDEIAHLALHRRHHAHAARNATRSTISAYGSNTGIGYSGGASPVGFGSDWSGGGQLTVCSPAQFSGQGVSQDDDSDPSGAGAPEAAGTGSGATGGSGGAVGGPGA
jgi:hypothetical protein